MRAGDAFTNGMDPGPSALDYVLFDIRFSSAWRNSFPIPFFSLSISQIGFKFCMGIRTVPVQTNRTRIVIQRRTKRGSRLKTARTYKLISALSWHAQMVLNFFTKRQLKIWKTISAHSKSSVSNFRTFKKIFISWHYPFKETDLFSPLDQVAQSLLQSQ